MSGLEIKYDGKSFASLQGLLDKFPAKVVKEFKVAVEYTKKVIVTDFMNMQDGKTAVGKRKVSYGKRTAQPGVRVVSGALRRGVNTTGKIEAKAGELIAKIYVPDNVDYGNDLEKNPKYSFLKPGFEKAKPALNDMLLKIRAHFR